jgi:hypothetical protein
VLSRADRRAFLATALGTLTVASAQAAQGPEVPNVWADVPSGATLWGLVVFTGPDPIELTVAAGKSIKVIRGRFGGQRLTEYSWRNTGRNLERVAVTARALAGDRELPAARVQFISAQNLYVAFGRRSTPEKLEERSGGYPFEALFVGFIVFESKSEVAE